MYPSDRSLFAHGAKEEEEVITFHTVRLMGSDRFDSYSSPYFIIA